MGKQTESDLAGRVHDLRSLTRRWRAVARGAGLRMEVFARADGCDLHVLRPVRAVDGPSLYLSAGIHGDEPAATEALVAWAERRREALSEVNLLIFPCLNPWGLVNNCRTDAAGRDLNRAYRRSRLPRLRAQQALLQGRTFDAAIMLHEDFDARGVYIYEIPGSAPWWAETLLEAATPHIAPDPRRRIEGRGAHGGILRKRIKPETLPGHPEAFFLHFGHTRRCLTIETPSEFGIGCRVAAHVAMLDAAWDLLLARAGSGPRGR